MTPCPRPLGCAPVKRLSILRAMSLCVALTLVGTACGGGATSAATVNGSTITRSDVMDELNELIAAVKNPTNNPISDDQKTQLLDQLTDSAHKSPSAAAAAELLTNKIVAKLVDQAMVQYNLTVADEDTTASTADIKQSLYSLDSVAAKTRDAAILQGARTSRVSRFLSDTTNKWYTDADVTAFYELGKKEAFSQACVAHILVADETLAKKLASEIKGGADFATLAAANSIDTSNKDTGGDLGCNAKGAFVPEFEAAVASAKDGEVVGPVKTQYGFHVIKVKSAYKERSLDDALKTDIAAQLAQPKGWLDLTIGRSKITVNRSFGTWDAKNARVNPPAGATSSTTSTVPAALPSSDTGPTGASNTGASGTGASGTGASGTGASGTGASSTGASGTGASGTGASGK